MQAASLSRAGNGMLMNVLVLLWLTAASVHRGATTGFAAIPPDSVLLLQVSMYANDFCCLSCPFVNQYKIQVWHLTIQVSGSSGIDLGGLGYVYLFGEWTLYWRTLVLFQVVFWWTLE